jgi:hypothetical protein
VLSESADIYALERFLTAVLPLGHLSFAYLCYLPFAAITTHRLPARWALLWVFLGSQFPDLVDKPLAYIGVLSYGRSLAHSLFTFLAVSAVVWWVVHRRRSKQMKTLSPSLQVLPAAFSIAYLSHLIGDASKALLAGNYFEARFLLYPLYGLPESPADDIPPWVRLFEVYQSMDSHPQVLLILGALLLFIGLRIWSYLRSPSRNAGQPR